MAKWPASGPKRIPSPRPKRAFGRSLADFLLEGTTTPHGLHPAEALAWPRAQTDSMDL